MGAEGVVGETMERSVYSVGEKLQTQGVYLKYGKDFITKNRKKACFISKHVTIKNEKLAAANRQKIELKANSLLACKTQISTLSCDQASN